MYILVPLGFIIMEAALLSVVYSYYISKEKIDEFAIIAVFLSFVLTIVILNFINDFLFKEGWKKYKLIIRKQKKI